MKLPTVVSSHPETLGAIRFLVCGWFLLLVVATSFSALGRLPVTIMHPPGIMEYFSWKFYDRLITPNGMVGLKCVMMFCLFAATIGLLTSVATKLSFVTVVLYEGILRSFGHFNHDECVAIIFLLILASTPCGDSFSIDSLVTRRARPPSFVYSYPVFLMWAVMAWAYFSAGILKLRLSGLSFFSPDNLPVLSILHSLDNLHDTQFKIAFWLPSIRTAMPIFVAIAVAWEILFPLILLVPRLKWPFVAFGVLFHASTMLLMNIAFLSQLAMYVVFVDWHSVNEWLRRRNLLPGANVFNREAPLPHRIS